MADFIKLRGETYDLYYNRNLIVSFFYSPKTNQTTLGFTGGPGDFTTVPGDQTEEILHGEAVGG